MSPSQPHENPQKPESDNSDSFVLVMEDWGEPINPQQREQLLRSQRRFRENLLDERCSIAPENLKKLRIAAERLGISEGDLICQGLDLVLQKHRDKFADLLAPELSTDAPKSENGLPSA